MDDLTVPDLYDKFFRKWTGLLYIYAGANKLLTSADSSADPLGSYVCILCMQSS